MPTLAFDARLGDVAFVHAHAQKVRNSKSAGFIRRYTLPMRTPFIVALSLTLIAAFPAAQSRQSKTLDIYVVDVEGGNATLFVSPSGESLLIDTGNAGAVAAPRDAGRIMEAVHDAGLTQIDNLIITHWHGDHFGGLAELARQIPIKHYW